MYDFYDKFPELLAFKPEISKFSPVVQDVVGRIILILHKRIEFFQINYESVKKENEELWNKINIIEKNQMEAELRKSASYDGYLFNNSGIDTQEISDAEYKSEKDYFNDGKTKMNRAMLNQNDQDVQDHANKKIKTDNKVLSTHNTNAFSYEISNDDKVSEVQLGAKNRDACRNVGDHLTDTLSLQNAIYRLNRENIILKEKNEQLSREMSFILDDCGEEHVRPPVRKYINDYYDLVKLLKNACRLNSTIRDENTRLKAALQIERTEKERKIGQFKESIVEKTCNLKKENTELKIVNKQFGDEIVSIKNKYKQLEKNNHEYMSKCKLLEIENYDLNFRINIYMGLERKLDEKNAEIKINEFKVNEKELEIARLREDLRDSENKIHDLIVKRPMKQTLLEYRHTIKETRVLLAALKKKVKNILEISKTADETAVCIFKNYEEIINDRKMQISTFNDEIAFLKERMQNHSMLMHKKNETIENMANEAERMKNEREEALNKLTTVCNEYKNLQQTINRLIEEKNTAIKGSHRDVWKLLEIERDENRNELEKYKKLVDLCKTKNIQSMMQEIDALKLANKQLEDANNKNHEQWRIEKNKILEQHRCEMEKINKVISDLSVQLQTNAPEFRNIKEFVEKITGVGINNSNELKLLIATTVEKCKALDEKVKSKDKSIENFKNVIIKLRSVNEKMLKRIKD